MSLGGEIWIGHLAEPSSDESMSTLRDIAARFFGVPQHCVRLIETPSSPNDRFCIMAYAENEVAQTKEVIMTSLSEDIWNGVIDEPESEASMATLRSIAARHFRVLSKHIRLVMTDHDLAEPLLVTAYADVRPVELQLLACRKWHELILPPPLAGSSEDDELGMGHGYDAAYPRTAFSDSSDSSF
jgi:hypothetical protein